MDEKQKMLLLKIANNSIAAASAVAADNDYGNVSAFFHALFSLFSVWRRRFSVFHVSIFPSIATLDT